MGITVGHDVNPTVIGQAALAGGYGQYVKWQQQQAQQMQMQQNQLNAEAQRQQAQIDASTKSQQNQFDYQNQRDSNLADNESGKLDQQFQNQSALQDQQNQGQIALQDNATANKKDLTDYEYTAQQKQLMQQLKDSHQLIDNDETLSDQEKDYAHKQVDAKIMGIKPFPVSSLTPNMSDEVDKNSYSDPQTGAIYTRDENGKLKVSFPPAPKPEKEQKDRISATELSHLYKEAREALTTQGENGPIPPDQDKVESYVQRMIDMHGKVNGRSAQPAPVAAPETAGVAAQPPAADQAPPDADQAPVDAAQNPPIPPPDAPHELKAQAFSFYLQRLTSDPRYLELGPAGKSVIEKQLHDRIFGEGQ